MSPRSESQQIPRTLVESAVSVLYDMVMEGEFQPGDWLRIDALAEQLDMSPMPIRQALRQLEALGLVEHLPHRGARIPELTLADLKDTYRARLLIEPLVTAKAASRFSSNDAATARRALEQWSAAKRRKDVAGAVEAHRTIHFAIYAAAGSRWLTRCIRPAFESSERYIRLRSPELHRDIARAEADHESIIAACEATDSELAYKAMYEHLARTANLVGTILGSADLFPPSPPPGAVRDLTGV